jgi:guanylate kinase
MKLSNVNLIVISGPSGSGKGTLINKCLQNNQSLTVAISATTRPPRENEVHGQDYYFLSDKQFDQYITEDKFVENCQVHQYRYGTLKEELVRLASQNKVVLLEIDTKGAQEIKKSIDSAIFIFIAAPDLDILKNRLIERKTETLAQIEKRLQTAERELTQIELYDYVIINDIIEIAFFELKKIIKNTFIA